MPDVGHEVCQHEHLRIVIVQVDLILSDIATKDFVTECSLGKFLQEWMLKYLMLFTLNER